MKTIYGGWIRAYPLIPHWLQRKTLINLGVQGNVKYNSSKRVFEYCLCDEKTMYTLMKKWWRFWPDAFTMLDSKTMKPREGINIREAVARIKQLETKSEKLENCLDEIRSWCKAYPVAIFGKPDLGKARKLLESGGITLDSISAYAMRHVTEGVQQIINKTFEE
jgi:hypothetical protein